MTASFVCINEPTKELKHKIDSIRKSSSFSHLQRDVTYISVIASFPLCHLATPVPWEANDNRERAEERPGVCRPRSSRDNRGYSRQRAGDRLTPIISERKPFVYSEANTKPPDGNSFLSLPIKPEAQLSSLLWHQFYAESTAVSKNTEEPFTCEV